MLRGALGQSKACNHWQNGDNWEGIVQGKPSREQWGVVKAASVVMGKGGVMDRSERGAAQGGYRCGRNRGQVPAGSAREWGPISRQTGQGCRCSLLRCPPSAPGHR